MGRCLGVWGLGLALTLIMSVGRVGGCGSGVNAVRLRDLRF